MMLSRLQWRHRMGDVKERLRKMEERIIKSNILPTGFEEGKKKKEEARFKEILADNFPELNKGILRFGKDG